MTGYQEVFTDPSYYGQVLIMNNVHVGNYGVKDGDVESDGIKVKGVEDAFAGIAELERAWHRGKPYDVAFLDQMMPGMSGEDLAERIKSHPSLRDTKLVLVSSAGS